MAITNDRLTEIARKIENGNMALLAQEYHNLETFAMFAMRTFRFDPVVKTDIFGENLLRFIDLCRGSNYKTYRNLLGYFNRMLYNACLDELRRIKKLSSHAPLAHHTNSSQWSDVPRQDQIKFVCMILEKLVEKNTLAEIDVIILFLFFFLGRKQKHIAEITDYTPANVNIRLKKALGILKEQAHIEDLTVNYDYSIVAYLIGQAALLYVQDHQLKINIGTVANTDL